MAATVMDAFSSPIASQASAQALGLIPSVDRTTPAASVNARQDEIPSPPFVYITMSGQACRTTLRENVRG
jgi:hypothetical protein